MAIFEFTDKAEVAIICTLGDGATRDMLVVVMRDAADREWYLRYRFRYYDASNKDDPGAPDTKSVCEIKAKSEIDDPRGKLVEIALDMIATLKAAHFGGIAEIHHIHAGQDPMEALKDSQFFHMRVVLPDAGKQVH